MRGLNRFGGVLPRAYFTIEGELLMNRTVLVAALLAVCFLTAMPLQAREGHAPGVFFSQPSDKALVSADVKVVMVVEGMRLHPAGEVIKGTGHHHLIIDGGSVPKGEVVGKDRQHLHFGKGQTETVISLEPGKHTLTLQFADGAHHSYGRAMSRTIHITVKRP